MTNETDTLRTAVESLIVSQRSIFEQAVKSGVVRAITDIARTLGNRLNANYGPKYQLECKDRIVVYVDDYGHYATVKQNGHLIMSTHNERLFVPGSWVEDVLALKPESDQKQLIELTTRLRKELVELCDRLCIDQLRNQL